MNNYGLVEFVKSRLGQGYIYGAYFDRIITDDYIKAKAQQYPGQYTVNYIGRSRKWIGQYAGDCVGLIKAYYWYDGKKIVYGYQGRADTSADGMLRRATVKGDIKTMPDTPGLFVHYSGHVGVYIGNGEVIESRGVDYGVVKTKLSARPWTSWGQVPYLNYEEDAMFAQRGQGTLSRPDAAVIALQNAFVKLGIPMKNDAGKTFTKADGSYGGATANGVKEFEKKYGLSRTDGNSFSNKHLTILISHLTVQAGQDCTALELEVAGLSAELKAKQGELSGIKHALDTLRSV